MQSQHYSAEGGRAGSQAEDTALVVAVTRVVRAADEAFEADGGSSRHWVRDHFLPRLNDAGLRVEYEVKARGI